MGIFAKAEPTVYRSGQQYSTMFSQIGIGMNKISKQLNEHLAANPSHMVTATTSFHEGSFNYLLATFLVK